MKTINHHRPGVTLTELMVYVAVLGIAVVMFSKFMMGFMKTAKTTESKMLGSADLRSALIKMENDLYEANAFTGVSGTSITFVCDMLKNPAWDRNADLDGDGIPNIKDPDADSDAQLKFSLPLDDQWKAGYNLEDDDDDNDNNRDVVIQLYYTPAARTLWRSLSVNGGAPQLTKLAADISSFTFTFYGSKREDLGKDIDLGNDGAANTNDAGEGDGVISEREIDWVLPPVPPAWAGWATGPAPSTPRTSANTSPRWRSTWKPTRTMTIFRTRSWARR